MPDHLSELRILYTSVSTDATLSLHEKERRKAILCDISVRLKKQEGDHVARSHPGRARQFMPFAALKGYHELARERERTPEPKRAMTEELSAELSEITSRLTQGTLASIVHYEGDQYITTCGVVTKVDETFRTLCIVKKHIAFDNILSIEILV